jgi:HSP20 family protein
MALMKRGGRDIEWPEWPLRRLLDWPESWGSMLEESGIRIEEVERDGQKVIRAELPGIDPDTDVEITVANGVVHIRGERREEDRHEDERGYRTEFRYGSFSRSVTLPPGANEDDVQASYQDGVLEVRVPLGDETATRKVPVSRG